MRCLSVLIFTFVINCALCTNLYDENSLKQIEVRCANHNDTCSDIMQAFTEQKFQFRHVAAIKLFTLWLRVLYTMSPQKGSVCAVAKFTDRIVRITSNVTHQMRLASDDMYYKVAMFLANQHSRACFESYQNFFNSYVIWAPDRYKTLLATYASLRSDYKHSRRYVAMIDNAALQLMTITLQYPLVTMRPQHVRQESYIYYVSKLPDEHKKMFSGLYESVEQQQFPQTTILHAGPVNITVHHDIRELDTLNRMQEECNFVYSNFVGLWQRLNLTYSHTIMNVNMYVYKNVSEYKRTGLMYATDIDNGGVAMYHYSPRAIVTLVYMEDDKVIPHAFGHELFHCMLYSSNRRVLRRLNSDWFVEGAANRFGFRKCIWRDHMDLKMYKQKTINEIVKSNYYSSYLYGMGSALVAFLYEKKPDILREAVLSFNYSIVADDILEQEFTRFKNNRIQQCNYVRAHQQTPSSPTVQQQYLAILPNNTFNGLCQNYIRIDFDNGCVFIMTPNRLYKTSNLKNASQLNVQYELRTNNEDVSSFDLEFFLKGAFKLAVKYMLQDPSDPYDIANKYFSVDTKYSYACRASCQNRNADPSQAIVNFVLASPIINKSVLRHVARPREMISSFEQAVLGCQVFIAPPVMMLLGQFRSYVEHVEQLRDQHIAVVNLVKPLDASNNTIMHLAALHNPVLFERILAQHRTYATTVVNADRQTAMAMFENTQKYIRRFRHAPNKYCTTIVPGNYTYTYRRIQRPLNYTKRLTHRGGVIAYDVNNETISNASKMLLVLNKNVTHNFDNNLLIVTTEVIVGIVIVISINTIFTIKFVKHYVRKTNSNKIVRYNSTNNFNKQKFYNDCSESLF
uniref:Mabr_orf37 n=1 Tax=Mamestra brassicae nuclear polyhedrosis virus TaxID=78219 RepID=J7HDF4_NPVMB|nr:Mabr_orf37 [Mamestra brassicae multiple nucleopolyhedrovirus]